MVDFRMVSAKISVRRALEQLSPQGPGTYEPEELKLFHDGEVGVMLVFYTYEKPELKEDEPNG